MLIFPSIVLRFKSPLIDETFEPVMLISRLPEARVIEVLAIRFEALDRDDSVVEVDFNLVISAYAEP